MNTVLSAYLDSNVDQRHLHELCLTIANPRAKLGFDSQLKTLDPKRDAGETENKPPTKVKFSYQTTLTETDIFARQTRSIEKVKKRGFSSGHDSGQEEKP